MSMLLQARGLFAGYDGAAVVRDLDLHVKAGEVVALLGPNGSGKSTTLLTLAGDLAPVGGTVEVERIAPNTPLHRRARSGVGLVPEEKSVFMGLTTAENIRLARIPAARVLDIFPELAPKLKVQAGLLSGGEQQMLTLGRILAREPRLLLADELSLGLAPLVVDRLLRTVREAADRGVGVLLVEQHVSKVLTIADRVYLLRNGQLVMSCTAEEAAARMDEITSSYLGTQGSAERN